MDVEHFRSGYKLQLMLYLKAATQKQDVQPAGVFLFKIREIDNDADVKSIAPGVEATEERMEDAYKLEGIVLDDMDMIGSMDTELAGTSKVIPIKYVKKSGAYASSAGGGQPGGADLSGDLRRQDRHPSEKRKEKRPGGQAPNIV